MIQLPPQPWKEGDEFTVDETGIRYVYDGEKFLSESGEEADLSGFVSKTGGDEMEGPLNIKAHSGDSRGTSRIKALGLFSGSSNSALRLGTTGDRIYIDSENTQFNGGIMVNNLGPKTQDGRGVTLNVEGTGDKHLVTKEYVDNKAGGSNYVTKTDSWDMALGTSLAVNVLKNIDGGTPFVYYEGDPEGTHPCGLVNRYMLHDYVDKKLADSSQPELPKFKMVDSNADDWGNGSVAFFDGTGNSTTTMNSTRGIIVSAFDVDGKRWGRDAECMEYVKHFNGHFNVTSENGKKTLFNMSPHYNSKCELFYWPGDDEYPDAGYIIQWQGFQSYTVTSRESEWRVGSFYRLSIPEVFF